MSLPDVVRCILRTVTEDGYREVMSKPVGSFSLQDAVAVHRRELALGMTLDATSTYPAMVIVDLVPATRAVLGQTATFIVLPPFVYDGDAASTDKDHRDSTPRCEQAVGAAGDAADQVSVWLDASLAGHECRGSPSLLRALALEDGAVVGVGDAELSCVFALRVDPTAPAEEEVQDDSVADHVDTERDGVDGGDRAFGLHVSPELYRNLRAAYWHQRPFLAKGERGDNRLYFTASHFDLDLDLITALEDDKGAVVCLRDAARREALLAEQLVLCPAVDDFVLSNLYGERYADFLHVAIIACAGQLQDRLVSEGDVIMLDLDATSLRESPLAEGLDVVEAVHDVLQHQTQTWDGISLDEHAVDSYGVLALRVVEVRRAAGDRTDAAHPRSGVAPLVAAEAGMNVMGGYGIVQLRRAERIVTQLSLVSQSHSTVQDYTPLYAPRLASTTSAALETTRLLRAAVTPYSVASHEGRAVTIVLHGVRENWPTAFAARVLAEVGVPAVLVNVQALDSEALQTLLQRFHETGGTVALVLRNAQLLLSEHAHLLPLLSAACPVNGKRGGEGRCGAGSGVHDRRRPAETAPGTRWLILVCESLEAVAPALAARANNPEGVLECGNPSEEDRHRFIAGRLDAACRRHGVQLSLLLSPQAMAAWSVGLPYADLAAYVADCVAAAVQSARDYPPDVRPVLSELLCETELQRYLKAHGLNLVSTKLQPVRWSDVGGLQEAKKELRETIQLPILHPELFTQGMKKRTGILFYGPPGCGKTLLAKAVATEMNMNFMSVKGPELINQYVGESERNIRLLFQRARDNSPCIVFFDELDALAPARGAKGDAGGAMDRIVAQLLVEVDGAGQTRSDGTSSGDVFIIGATNRPDLLDPALLRPGRFDRLCYLGLPSTRAEQMYALRALTRKFDLATDVDFDALLAPLECVYTGADFFALCSDAMMFAVEESLAAVRAALDAGAAAMPDSEDTPTAIKVRMEHFVRARDQLKPSVSKEDLRRYESIKHKFKQ